MQKVFKNGNSLAVTIPKVYANELSIEPSSPVVWKKTKAGLLLKSAKKNSLPDGITPEFVKLVNEFMEEHNDVLRELAKR